jgi:WD40 repeat protein
MKSSPSNSFIAPQGSVAKVLVAFSLMLSIAAGIGRAQDAPATAPSDTADDAPPECPGVMRSILQGHTDTISCVDISSGGIVASGGCDNTARIWEPSTGKEKFVLKHAQEVHDLAFSGDGKVLATGCPDKIVYLWDTATGKHITTLSGMSSEINMVALSADGSIAAAAGGMDGVVWDTKTGKALCNFSGQFALSPDGKLLL